MADLLESSGFEFGRSGLFDNRFLDIAQLVLAEEHFLADKERRRAERSPCNCVIGILNQLFLDIILLRTDDQAVDIDTGRDQGAPENLEVVHFLRTFPHMVVGSAEIGLENILELRRNRAAHQHQRVDREKRIRPERRDVVALKKALRFERLVFRLILDPAQRLERRHVVGRLVDTAKQYRDIIELDPGTFLDRRKNKFREVGIRTAEIELKFNLQGTTHGSLPFDTVEEDNGGGPREDPSRCVAYF